MEKITLIKKDIEEKKGKEWLGLQKKTKNKLESLLWYLKHPKLQEYPKLVEEIVEFYYTAKNTNFIKMEDIIRKLDQLRTKLSKENVIKMNGTVQSYASKWDQVNYFKAIGVFKKKVEDLLNSTSGISLSEKTKNSIITFLNYLNHPELKNKSALFEEMKDKYKEFKKLNFLSIQAFDDMLNKCDIKLGAVTEKLNKWKSPEELKRELKKELDKEREKIEEEKEILKKELKILEKQQGIVKAERDNLKAEQEKLEAEHENLKTEQEKLEVDRSNLKAEQEKLEAEHENLKTEQEKIKVEREELKREQEKIEGVYKNLKTEQEKMEVERENLKAEQEKLKTEHENFKKELRKLQIESVSQLREQEKVD